MYLAAALNLARDAQMPKTNVEAAIAKGKAAASSGKVEGESVLYEGLWRTISVVVIALTDNRNRTAAEMRLLFKDAGGSLGPVLFQFNRCGRLLVAPGTSGDPLDAVADWIAVEADGVDDVRETTYAREGGADSVLEVLTPTESVMKVQSALQERGYEIVHLDPAAYVPIGDPPVCDDSDADAFAGFLEKLQSHDDVIEVYTNAPV
ncbi:hypothetical protein HK405_007210 [Cladochytrium tenue]|nr:hypothetical protein HK405_007210 [Cladochytrium tenue]